MDRRTEDEQHIGESVDAEQDYLSVLDTIPYSYFETNHEGVITFANQALQRMVGLSDRGEIIGLPFERFTAPLSVRSFTELLSAMFATQRSVPRFEYCFRRIDGSIGPAEASISPMVRDGEVVGARGFIRDASDNVQAEARAAELSAVGRVAATVSRSLNLDDVLQSICEELTAIFPVRNAGVGLISSDRKHLEVVAFHSPHPGEKSALGMTLPFADSPSSQEVIRSRRTLVIQDSQTDPRSGSMSEIARARGTRAIMIVPLLSRGEAIGTIGMPATDPFHVFTDKEVELAETIANQIAVAIDNARLYSQTESALTIAERDLEIGREIQSGFFPQAIPEIPGWEIAAEFQPARHVAGDFYDVFRLKNAPYTAFAIADVCDKGVGAALFMVLFRSLLRAFSERIAEGPDLERQLLSVLDSTNTYIAEYHGRSNMFATIFFGLLDPESGDFHYINGGHEPPIVLNKSGEISQRLSPTGPAVGLFPGLEYAVRRYRFRNGDCLVGFTDGTTDARNGEGARFTEKRLLGAVAHQWTSLYSMLFELKAGLRSHIGEQLQFDDITLFAIRRTERGTHPTHAICRPATVETVPEVRTFVESAASYCGLTHDVVVALKSAADEICTNIAQYGYPDAAPGVLSVELTVDSTRGGDGSVARVTITDDGMHFPPDAAPAPDLSADWASRQSGGLGLYLARQFVDSVSYERIPAGANRLVLEKHITHSNTGGLKDSGDS